MRGDLMRSKALFMHVMPRDDWRLRENLLLGGVRSVGTISCDSDG